MEKQLDAARMPNRSASSFWWISLICTSIKLDLGQFCVVIFNNLEEVKKYSVLFDERGAWIHTMGSDCMTRIAG